MELDIATLEELRNYVHKEGKSWREVLTSYPDATLYIIRERKRGKKFLTIRTHLSEQDAFFDEYEYNGRYRMKCYTVKGSVQELEQGKLRDEIASVALDSDDVYSNIPYWL
jgi:hypothetical protein